MATFAARRLLPMAENALGVIGIELLAAHHLVRKLVSFYEKDRYFAPDIAKIKLLIQSGILRTTLALSIFSL
jgi:histidine ammonia-lyase